MHKQVITTGNYKAFSCFLVFHTANVFVCTLVTCRSLKWLLIESFLMSDQVKYLFVLILGSRNFVALVHNLCFPDAFSKCFSVHSPAVMVFPTLSPHCIFPPSPLPSPPLPSPPVCSLLDEKPFWWLIGEWCCYLESHSISTEGGEESARREREKLRRSSGSLGRCSCDGWAVKRPIVQITQQAPCHHPGLIYGAARCSTDIALGVESAGETRGGKGCTGRSGGSGLTPSKGGRTGLHTQTVPIENPN